MATRTKGGLLLPVILVAVVAVFGLDTIVSTVQGLFTGGGTAVIGEGDSRVMVASEDQSKAETCTTAQLVIDKRCGDLKVVVMDAAKMPFITRNMLLAWTEGKPGILTRNKAAEKANRAAACPPGRYPQSFPDKGSCEEFPFAPTSEGGKNARTAHVPLRENACQGGTLR